MFTLLHTHILPHTHTYMYIYIYTYTASTPSFPFRYGAAFVDGMEHDPSDPEHILASSCCKHYVANSVEMSTENGLTWNRFEINSVVTEQDLVDSYMPAFQSCVEKGRVSGLMCSLNAVNGVPACANSWLMNDVARKDWGFDGYVSTDCDGYAQSYEYHKNTFNVTPEEGVRDMIRAVSITKGGFFLEKIEIRREKEIAPPLSVLILC